MAGGLPGYCVKKLNQSLTKFHPGIPDIGGQEPCFLPVKKKKTAARIERRTSLRMLI
jgi:hypothetical protein